MNIFSKHWLSAFTGTEDASGTARDVVDVMRESFFEIHYGYEITVLPLHALRIGTIKHLHHFAVCFVLPGERAKMGEGVARLWSLVFAA